MKLRKIILGVAIGTVSAIAGLSCERGETKENQPRDVSRTEAYKPSAPFYTDARDGSRILVIEKSDGNFTFYRDKDRDGYADYVGSGSPHPWGPTPILSKERDIKSSRRKMDDLKERPAHYSMKVGW